MCAYSNRPRRGRNPLLPRPSCHAPLFVPRPLVLQSHCNPAFVVGILSHAGVTSSFFLTPGTFRGVWLMYLPHEEGQGLFEYALILMLVAVVVIAMLTIFGQQLDSMYRSVTGLFP